MMMLLHELYFKEGQFYNNIFGCFKMTCWYIQIWTQYGWRKAVYDLRSQFCIFYSFLHQKPTYENGIKKHPLWIRFLTKSWKTFFVFLPCLWEDFRCSEKWQMLKYATQLFLPLQKNHKSLFFIREGVKKNRLFLENSPKQRTPPTHRSGLGLT